MAGTPVPPPYLPTNKLRIKGGWIILFSRSTLWLPPEYRPDHWASKGNTIAVGSGNGRVTFVDTLRQCDALLADLTATIRNENVNYLRLKTSESGM
jgi:hypothetical protein